MPGRDVGATALAPLLYIGQMFLGIHHRKPVSPLLPGTDTRCLSWRERCCKAIDFKTQSSHQKPTCPDAITFEAVCGANMVTRPPNFGGLETLAAHRVACLTWVHGLFSIQLAGFVRTGCWTGPPRGERAPRVSRAARPQKVCGTNPSSFEQKRAQIDWDGPAI